MRATLCIQVLDRSGVVLLRRALVGGDDVGGVLGGVADQAEQVVVELVGQYPIGEQVGWRKVSGHAGPFAHSRTAYELFDVGSAQRLLRSGDELVLAGGCPKFGHGT
jgi:hypothetical protein